MTFQQAIWGDIWKRTLEKSQTNVTNVIVDENGWKQKKVDENGWRWMKVDKNRLKLMKIDEVEVSGIKMDESG